MLNANIRSEGMDVQNMFSLVLQIDEEVQALRKKLDEQNRELEVRIEIHELKVREVQADVEKLKRKMQEVVARNLFSGFRPSAQIMLLRGYG
jgi:hypothetical protein